MERPNDTETLPLPRKEPKEGVIEYPISVKDVVILAHLKDITRIQEAGAKVPPEAVASFKDPSDLAYLLRQLRSIEEDRGQDEATFLLRECDDENCKRLWPKLAKEEEPHYHIDAEFLAKNGKKKEWTVYNLPAAAIRAWRALTNSKAP